MSLDLRIERAIAHIEELAASYGDAARIECPLHDCMAFAGEQCVTFPGALGRRLPRPHLARANAAPYVLARLEREEVERADRAKRDADLPVFAADGFAVDHFDWLRSEREREAFAYHDLYGRAA